jgi:hypothetical protein
LVVNPSGCVKISDREEGHRNALSGEFTMPFVSTGNTGIGDLIGSFDWFNDAIIVLDAERGAAGGLFIRDSSPVPVRIYFPHIRQGVNFSMVWQNSDKPSQNPRYGDDRGLCSSPDVYKACVVAATLLVFSRAASISGARD